MERAKPSEISREVSESPLPRSFENRKANHPEREFKHKSERHREKNTFSEFPLVREQERN